MKKTKTKSTAAGKRLIAAGKEVLAHYRGETTLPSYTINVPTDVNVSNIRKNLGYSQREFSEHYGFALSAVKDWEQGRRKPERATRIFLAVIAMNPKIIEKALARL